MLTEAEGRREDFGQLYKQKETLQVELIDRILSDENIKVAIHAARLETQRVSKFRQEAETATAESKIQTPRLGATKVQPELTR